MSENKETALAVVPQPTAAEPLPQGPTFRKMVANFLATYGLVWAWVTAFVGIFAGLLDIPTGNLLEPTSVIMAWAEKWEPLRTTMSPRTLTGAFMALVFAPVVEEALFRLLPLSLAMGLRREKVWAINAVVGGIVFGALHGHAYNVFIQGFVGLMLGWLYVHNHRSQLSAYLSCVAMHSFYNFTVAMLSV